MEEKYNFSTIQDFFHNDNDEVKKFSPNLNWGLRICSSGFHQDIQSQIDELAKMHFSYQEETEKLRDKYIVFYHEDKQYKSGVKHKFIIQPLHLYCGSNGHCGGIRMKCKQVKDDYVLQYKSQELTDEIKCSVDGGINISETDIDCRKLFHYVTYYFSPRYYQGTKICNTLKEAESYYNEICDQIHYWNNKLVLNYGWKT